MTNKQLFKAQISLRVVLVCLAFLIFSQAGHTEKLAPANATWARKFLLTGFDSFKKHKITDTELIAFSLHLKQKKIRYVYLFSGPFQKEGFLPAYAFSQQAHHGIAIIKKAYPELKVLAWIGGVESKTVYLESESWIKNSLNSTTHLVNTMPFDGVHIDLEYLVAPASQASKFDANKYAPLWLLFHKNLRERLPQTFISTTVVSTAKNTQPWKLKHSVNDLRAVSQFTDQIALMFYETNLHNLTEYREALRDQLLQIKQLNDERSHKMSAKNPQYLIGVGTFKNQPPLQAYRDMRFENLPTTLNLLTELINQISQTDPTQRLIDGLAIYSEWLTLPKDWNQIEALWNKKQ